MNEHIVNFCKEYIISKYTSDFSILLKGPWGCGKTFFINNLIGNMLDDNSINIDGDDIIYISIFGISTVSEIEEKLFEAIHPILSSQGMKLASTFFKQAIKLGINIDLNGDSKTDGSVSLAGLDIFRNLKNGSYTKKLLIIDDIERCELKPNELLGYFSNYIFEQGIKIIFIGNEDEYIKNNEELYSKIREKVIGYTFTVLPDLEHAIESFISEYNINISEANNIIFKVIKTLNINNLRIIRRGIIGFNLLLNRIPNIYHRGEYVSKLLETYLVLFIQYSKGSMKIEDIDYALTGYFKYEIDLNDFKKNREGRKKNDILFDYCTEWVPLKTIWKEIIFETNLNKDIIIQNVIEDYKGLFPNEHESNLGMLLKYWTEMDSDTFKKHYFDFKKELDTGIYKHPGELLHSYALLYRFSEYAIIPEKYAEVDKYFYSLVEGFSNKVICSSSSIKLGYFDSYMGYGFPRDIEGFNKFREFIIDLSNDNNYIRLKGEFVESIQEINKNIDNILLDLYHVNGTGKYYNLPVLSWIKPNKLFESLKQLSFTYQENFIYALNERYGKKYSNGTFNKEYSSDYNNLCVLKDLYHNEYLKFNKEYEPIKVSYLLIVNKLKELIEFIDDSQK